MPIYLINVDNTKPTQRLVEAKSEAGARKHVAEDILTLEPVRTTEQIRAMAALSADGVKVETAKT